MVKVVEKPGAGHEPSSYVRLVCDFFVNADSLIEAIDNVEHKNVDVLYEEALSLMMRRGQKFEMMEYQGYWLAVKYPWHLLSAVQHFLGRIKQRKIHQSCQKDARC